MGSHIAGEIAHIKERETLDNSTEQGEKINSTTTPMVARGRCQEGLAREPGARWEGARGVARESGGPLTHPGTRAYTRTLRFLPHILNEHTAATYLRAHDDGHPVCLPTCLPAYRPVDRPANSRLVIYFLFLFPLSLRRAQ